MIKQFTLLIVSILLSTSVLKSNVTLTIEISKLKNSTGKILLELTDENKKVIKGISEEIKNNKCIIIIKNLKPGKYTFKYFHDENNNEELDTNWIGIPKEGFGFSNNAMGMFGPPSFEDTIFILKSDSTLKCNPRYI